MLPESQNIKNIIFDFGGVILDIDYSATCKAFEDLGMKDAASQFSKHQQSPLFKNYETGAISSRKFIEEVQQLLGSGVGPDDIVEAWCAMLHTIPAHRMEALEELSREHNLFLLSNTNHLHKMRFMETIDEQYGRERFLNLFSGVYMSHEIGMRKPHKEVFDRIVLENGVRRRETIFIDDTEEHTIAAAKAGLKTHWLHNGEDVADICAELTNKKVVN